MATAPSRFLRRIAANKGRKTKPVAIAFPGDLHDWLKDVSTRTGIPLSRVVVEAVREVRESEQSDVAAH